jgi:hypothetical protein
VTRGTVGHEPSTLGIDVEFKHAEVSSGLTVAARSESRSQELD